jgi:hypothetical protein
MDCHFRQSHLLLVSRERATQALTHGRAWAAGSSPCHRAIGNCAAARELNEIAILFA